MRTATHNCLLAACLLTLRTTAAQDVANLLTNPGFEQLNAKGHAIGWSWGFYRGAGKIGVSAEVEHSGKHALVMSGLADSAGQCIARAPIPVTPDTPYRVDAWVRSSVGSAQLQIRWTNSDKGLPEQYAINVFRLEPGRWYQLAKLPRDNWNIYHRLGSKNRHTKLRHDRLFFAGTREVRFYVFTRPNGTVCYDDLFFGPAHVSPNEESAIAQDARDEYRRLLLDREPIPYPKADLTKKVVIEQPEFSKTFEPDPSFPPHGVTIRDGCFFRNGRHVFFLGAESGAPRPGIMRLLGFKVHCVTGTSTYDSNWTQVSDKGDHILVKYGEIVPLAPKLRDSIRFGFLPIVQTINNHRGSLIGRYGRPDLLVDQGHFIGYCPDHPMGRQLRANFWRSVMSVCRRYPILGYEHFNELGYLCYCKRSRELFKAQMAAKYESIEMANRAWGKRFTSFAEAEPPYRKGSNTAEHILPEGFSRPLWADWLRFTENHFGQIMADLMQSSREWDGRPDHFRSIQCHHLLRLDYVGTGVNPILKARTEGMFGFEVGQRFFPQKPGEENVEEIKSSFVGLPFYGGVIRGITEHLPVVNFEGGISRAQKTYAPAMMDAISLLPVQGEWRLAIDPLQRGKRERWYAREHDDSDWQLVPVTDVWDQHGHADYDGWGWYRKKIHVPAGLKGKRLWFNGKGLDDVGTIYINGQKVGSASGWNKSFSFDITDAIEYGKDNTFAIHIIDTTQYGGLRFFLGVNDFDLMQPNPVTRGMMRMYLWNHVIHGLDVAALSYFYAPESWPGSLFSPYKCSLDAIKAIAETEAEIDSVSDIVLPKPRIRGQFAIVYPLETFRAYVPATGKDWISYHATRDFLHYLVPLYCSDVDVDVLHSKHLEEGKATNYRVLFLRQYERVPSGMLKRLEEYVRAGGTLVVDHSSLRIDDERHTLIDATALTGVKVTGDREDLDRVAEWTTVARQVNATTGVRCELVGAQTCLAYPDGSPAVTVHTIGRGRVYFVAAELSYDGIAALIERLVRETLARSTIVTRRSDGARLRFVESHLLGRSGRYVATVAHYGGGREAVRIRLPEIPDGQYRVRNVDTRSAVPNPKGGKAWAAADLRKGVSTTLDSLNPLVLLVESASHDPALLSGLDPDRASAIDRLWANADDFHTRVLFEATYRRVDFVSTFIYTARQMLASAGYRWHFGMSPYTRNRGLIKCFDGQRIEERRQSDFGVLVFPSMHLWAHRWPKEEVEAVRQFVENGGGVLFLGRSFDRRGNWNVLRQFGIRDTSDLVIDEEHHVDDDPYFVTYTRIADHPATGGVRTFQSRGGSHIAPDGASQVLIQGSPSAVTRSGKVQAPVICVAKEVGKGRIVVVGDDRWTDPVFLTQADNAKLWMGLIEWLAGRR